MDKDARRLYLHNQLTSTFPDLNVYYRPPGNIILERPCIVYEPKAYDPSYSNNTPFVVGTRFQVMFLSDLPGYSSEDSILTMPEVTVYGNNTYVNEDIVHDVFTVLVNTIT